MYFIGSFLARRTLDNVVNIPANTMLLIFLQKYSCNNVFYWEFLGPMHSGLRLGVSWARSTTRLHICILINVFHLPFNFRTPCILHYNTCILHYHAHLYYPLQRLHSPLPRTPSILHYHVKDLLYHWKEFVKN
jgi:hypothetical protein